MYSEHDPNYELMADEYPSVEQQADELLDAGWKRYKGRPMMWQAPNGMLFLGPHGAWKIMRKQRLSAARLTEL